MNADGINLGRITEALNDKADRGLLNIEKNTDAVLAYQMPTAENNYTWYRIYKSGWVEQGGILLNLGSDADQFVTLPITMNDTNYTLVGGLHNKNDGYAWHSHASVGWDKTITGFTTSVDTIANSQGKDWAVSGQGDPNAVRNAIIDKMIEEGSSINYNIANLTDYIIAYQEPNSSNNYKWYRVWNSGWVEQGGYTAGGDNVATTITLPIKMQTTTYSLSVGGTHCINARSTDTPSYRGTYVELGCIESKTTETFVLGNGTNITWIASGQGDPEVIAEMIENSLLRNSVNTYIVEKQLPSAENNYTWYRKYSDGWVEQGGWCIGNQNTNLPITMSDSHYTITYGLLNSDSGNQYQYSQRIIAQTTTYFQIRTVYGGTQYAYQMYWQVSGMAATSNN